MEIKKLSQEELQQIQDIQGKNQALVSELGQIELIKLNLAERAEAAKQFLTELKQEEKELAQALEAAYGKGTINLDKGEFTPYQTDTPEVE